MNAPMMMRREGAACHGMAIGDGMDVVCMSRPVVYFLCGPSTLTFGRMEEKRKLLLIIESTNLK